MNCKPGDIAIVIHHKSVLLGRLVEVICVAPTERFRLPNGVAHLAGGANMWVVKSLGAPFPGALGDGMYGVGSDRGLRPIRGDEMLTTVDAGEFGGGND